MTKQLRFKVKILCDSHLLLLYRKEQEILHLCFTEESHNIFERAVESESDESNFIIVSLKWFKYNNKLRIVKQKHLLLSKKTIRTHRFNIQLVLQQSNLIKTNDKYTAKTFPNLNLYHIKLHVGARGRIIPRFKEICVPKPRFAQFDSH